MKQTKLTKQDLNISKSDKHYFLEIVNNEYDIFRSFETLKELLNHLSNYPIKNLNAIIQEINKNNGV